MIGTGGAAHPGHSGVGWLLVRVAAVAPASSGPFAEKGHSPARSRTYWRHLSGPARRYDAWEAVAERR